MSINYVTQIINGKVVVSDKEAPLLFSSDDELVHIAIDLISNGYAFTDEPSGWPPASIIQGLKEKGLIDQSFTAITWSGPGEYRTYSVA